MATIFQFINYKPVVYSGFDKFNVLVAQKLRSQGHNLFFVFFDTLDEAPELKEAIVRSQADIIFLKSGQNILARTIAIIKLLKQYKPEIVHVHFINQIKLLLACLRPFFRFQLFVSFHSKIWEGTMEEYKTRKGRIRYFFFKTYLYLLAVASEKVFCVSEATQKQYKAFVDRPNIANLHLGIERPHGTYSGACKKLGFNPQDATIRICNIGAIEYLKGLDVIVKALNILQGIPDLPPFQFCHIGGLRSQPAETDLAFLQRILLLQKEYRLEQVFHLLGKREDIMEILPAFDIYVHPSRSEGLDMAIIEACAYRLPVICTNTGGMPEIVEGLEDCYLIEKEDAEQLAEKLQKLIRKVYLGKNSLQHPLSSHSGTSYLSYEEWWQKFDIDLLTDKLINIYLNEKTKVQ